MVRWRLPLRRFTVADTSMQPSLYPGDRLLVSTWSRPQVGDIAVLVHPAQRHTLLVKRVAERTATGVLVRGDNPNVSDDSRQFGAVPAALVIGKVVFRYGAAGGARHVR
jgi:nickel-type superoxide dismutase maturation protease